MLFEELNDMIPYAMGGKEKIMSMEPYPNIKLLLPGRHAKDTTPKGGDFCVIINDPIFRSDHQFKHNDLFNDLNDKYDSGQDLSAFMELYMRVVAGDADPLTWPETDQNLMVGMDPTTFLCGSQCLAVAEHRRYAKYETAYGGRYLPVRFSAGITEGKWTANDAAKLERKGRPGVEQLERQYGRPVLTEDLMSNGKS